MMKQWWIGLSLIVMMAFLSFYYPSNQNPSLSNDLAQQLGRQIWQNECGGKIEGLTTWNQGENFASLGIGHFIWYPAGREEIFKQTFPDLLLFLKSHGVKLPVWLERANGCPWHTKEEFVGAQHQPEMQELRQLLAHHVDLQILFMVQRLNQALPRLLKNTSEREHSHLTYQFYRLAHTPGGLYVLLDYLNFKGEGTASHESYQGRGWGLLQVLRKLEGTEPGITAVKEFAKAAKEILTLRVENSPPERGELRWLKGWHNRLDTYVQFSLKVD